MSIIRILVALIQAILKAAVGGFLAIVALGAVWALGLAAIVAAILLALFGFGGWRVASRRRNRDGS